MNKRVTNYSACLFTFNYTVVAQIHYQINNLAKDSFGPFKPVDWGDIITSVNVNLNMFYKQLRYCLTKWLLYTMVANRLPNFAPKHQTVVV